VTWYDKLDADELVFLKTFGTLREAGVRAFEKEGFREEFEALSCSLRTADGTVYLHVPHRDVEEPAGQLVVAAHRADATGHEADEGPDLTGRPLPAVAVLDALRSYAAGASIQDVSKGDLSFRAARRVWSWVESGAAWWDPAARTARTAPGYRFAGGGSPDEPTLQLVRV
jgi:hypothetical protein